MCGLGDVCFELPEAPFTSLLELSWILDGGGWQAWERLHMVSRMLVPLFLSLMESLGSIKVLKY